jgi:hypothetical protein
MATSLAPINLAPADFGSADLAQADLASKSASDMPASHGLGLRGAELGKTSHKPKRAAIWQWAEPGPVGLKPT